MIFVMKWRLPVRLNKPVTQNYFFQNFLPNHQLFLILAPDNKIATLAQLVEQRFRKPQVGGSSPLSGSIL
jgi:hypothetical protein